MSQEDESEEEMETLQQSDDEAEEEQLQESSPKVNLQPCLNITNMWYGLSLTGAHQTDS